MDLLYPHENSRIFVPRELNGEPRRSIFELAHRRPNTEVYWHLDGQYLGATRNIHQFALAPTEGKHLLTIVDQHGEILERRFEVMSSIKR